MPEVWVRTEEVDEDTVLRSRILLDEHERFTIERPVLLRLLRDAGYELTTDPDDLDDLPHIGTS